MKDRFSEEAALRFLKNETLKKQFLCDIRRTPYPAPSVMGGLIDILIQNADFILNLFTTLSVTYIAYRAGRRAAESDKEQIIGAITKVIQDRKPEVKLQIEMNKRLQTKLKLNLAWQFQRITNRNFKFEWEDKVKLYLQKIESLEKDEAAKTICDILLEIDTNYDQENKKDSR